MDKQKYHLWAIPLRPQQVSSIIQVLRILIKALGNINDIETELTVLGGIMIQNLPRETGWHLRGIRRLEVSKEDVETIQQCVSVVTLGLYFPNTDLV